MTKIVFTSNGFTKSRETGLRPCRNKVFGGKKRSFRMVLVFGTVIDQVRTQKVL